MECSTITGYNLIIRRERGERIGRVSLYKRKVPYSSWSSWTLTSFLVVSDLDSKKYRTDRHSFDTRRTEYSVESSAVSRDTLEQRRYLASCDVMDYSRYSILHV